MYASPDIPVNSGLFPGSLKCECKDDVDSVSESILDQQADLIYAMLSQNIGPDSPMDTADTLLECTCDVEQKPGQTIKCKPMSSDPDRKMQDIPENSIYDDTADTLTGCTCTCAREQKSAQTIKCKTMSSDPKNDKKMQDIPGNSLYDELMCVTPPGTPQRHDPKINLRNGTELTISNAANTHFLHSPDRITDKMVKGIQLPCSTAVNNPMIDITSEPQLTITADCNTLRELPNHRHTDTIFPDREMCNRQGQSASSDHLILSLLTEKDNAQSHIATPDPAQQGLIGSSPPRTPMRQDQTVDLTYGPESTTSNNYLQNPKKITDNVLEVKGNNLPCSPVIETLIVGLTSEREVSIPSDTQRNTSPNKLTHHRHMDVTSPSEMVEKRQKPSTDHLILTLLAEKDNTQSHVTTGPTQQTITSSTPTSVSKVPSGQHPDFPSSISNTLRPMSPYGPRPPYNDRPMPPYGPRPPYNDRPMPPHRPMPPYQYNRPILNRSGDITMVRNQLVPHNQQVKQKQSSSSDLLILTLLAEKDRTQTHTTSSAPQLMASMRPTPVTMVPGGQQPGLPSSLTPSTNNITPNPIEKHGPMPPFQENRTILDDPQHITVVQNQKSPRDDTIQRHNKPPLCQHQNSMINSTLASRGVQNWVHGALRSPYQPSVLPHNGNIQIHTSRPFQAHQAYQSKTGNNKVHNQDIATVRQPYRQPMPSALSSVYNKAQAQHQGAVVSHGYQTTMNYAPTNINNFDNQRPTIRREAETSSAHLNKNMVQNHERTTHNIQQIASNNLPARTDSVIDQRPSITGCELTVSKCHSNKNVVQSHCRKPSSVQQVRNNLSNSQFPI